MTITSDISAKFRQCAVICALLVVAVHVGNGCPIGSSGWWLYQIFGAGLSHVAVPFFFFAAGFFLFGRSEGGSYRRIISSRSRSLLIPYIVFNALFAMELIILRLVQQTTHGGGFVRAQIFAGINIGTILGLDLFQMPILYPTWFIRVLFLYCLLSPVFLTLAKTRIRAVSSICLLAVCFAGFTFVESRYPACSWVRFVFSIEGAAYFLLGLLVRRHVAAFRACGKAGALCICFASVVILLRNLLVIRNDIDMTAYLMPLVTPFLLYGLFALPQLAFTSWKGWNPFGLYVLHPFGVSIGNIVFFKINASAPGQILEYACIVVCCAMIVLLGYRCLPNFTTVVLGARR